MQPKFIEYEGKPIPVFPYNLRLKRLRAEVIAEHLEQIGEPRCVCFTCGNAANALREQGVQVVEVGDEGELAPRKWFGYGEIQQVFNGLFDATSGHLPMPLMRKVAERVGLDGKIPAWVSLANKLMGRVFVPTGSGESIVVLNMAFPNIELLPVRFAHPATEYNHSAPLNALVYAITGMSHTKARSIGAGYEYKPHEGR